MHDQAVLESLSQVLIMPYCTMYMLQPTYSEMAMHLAQLRGSLARMLCRLCAVCPSLMSKHGYVFMSTNEIRCIGS